MLNNLSAMGYFLDPKSCIWMRPNYPGIAYCDGNEIEDRIAVAIRQSQDITVFSSELSQHCTDWPSIYHLSNSRANILRPFKSLLSGDILEIGAGCGAITRYLGECGGKVLALEGSPRRAEIARSRTRDLSNVTVVADNFENFKSNKRYDVITLIGVLEYANMFVKGDNPALAMLAHVSSMLKPNGKLIVAIENQLGLKYFAGAPEDHIGIEMYGIEGLYKKNQPQTYGSRVLEDMLKQAGFACSDFMAPFPDYKLPTSIIGKSGFLHKGFDAAAFAWQNAKRDLQLPPHLAFSPELAWPPIFQNGIAVDLANSFLIISHKSFTEDFAKNNLAWHFSTNRKKEYCKQTTFIERSNGSIEVQYLALEPKRINKSKASKVIFSFPENDKYYQGELLHYKLIKTVSQDGWCIDDLSILVKKYLTILSRESSLCCSDKNTMLPGEYIDIIPQNIIINNDDSWSIIDKEWKLINSVSVGRVLFRSLLGIIYSTTRFGLASTNIIYTPIQFIESVYNSIDISITGEEILEYAKQEYEFQEIIALQRLSLDDFLNWISGSELNVYNYNKLLFLKSSQVAQSRGFIAEKEGVIAEKDGVIVSLNEEVVSREGQIQALAAQVSEKEGIIAEKEGIIAEKEGIIAENEGIIAENEGIIAENEGVIAVKGKIIVDLENQLLEKKEALTGLSSEIDNLIESLSRSEVYADGLRGMISEKDIEIGVLSEGVNNRDAQISVLHEHIAEKENVMSQRDQDLQHLRAYLDLVKSSWSWRLTAPLRAVQEKAISIVQTLKRYRMAAWIIWTHRKTGVFDPQWYLLRYPDIKASGMNPWWHFAMYGLYEGRAPHEGFDVAYYADNNQDIASAFTNPLLHYALWGYSENRPWRAPASNSTTGEHDIKVPRALGRLAQPPIERLSAYPQRQWPLISVVMPTYNTPISFLDRAIESVRTQKYPYWELCIADDCSASEDVRARLKVQAASDTRIKLVCNTQNRGISCATNSAVAVATGSFCALLDHDDELAPEALAEVAVAILENPDADVVYTDQDKIDEDGIRFEPFHKPAWSPIYLQGVMYIGHLLVVRTEVLHKVGGCDSRYDKIQDFELMLRLHEVGAEVIHIPKILYHWRTLPGSIAASTDAKGNIESLQAAAVQSHLDRQRLPLQTKAHPSLPHRIQLFSAAKSDSRLVSIIIPTQDAPEHIRRCLDTLFGMTRGCSFEVIIADTGTTDSDAIEAQNTYPVKRIECPGPFNFSRANNIAAREAKGEFLLFLNNDTEVVDPDWLLTLLAHHSLPNVGAVGPILIYPNGEVQHAGVVIGARGTADHILRHVNPMCDGYAGSLPCAREVSAVTAACMMMPRDLFIELGGFNEDYARHYQDTDLCLRIREAGRSILHVGNVHLKHHESVSRGGIYDMVDRAIFQDRWFSILTEGDPFYNPNFKLDILNYTLR